jgi:hypothetical protein
MAVLLAVLRLFVFSTDSGKPRMVICSGFVGVTTVVVPPCQELLSNLKKLFREDDLVGVVTGRGTVKPSSSILWSVCRQSADSNNCVMLFSVVGVRSTTLLALSTIND